MTFLKRLFGSKEEKVIEPMRGGVPARNPDIDHAIDRGTRERMEAEVAGDRKRRGEHAERAADAAVVAPETDR